MKFLKARLTKRLKNTELLKYQPSHSLTCTYNCICSA